MITAFAKTLFAGTLALLLSACATGSDPYEPVNRRVMAVNDVADRALLKPLAMGYRTLAPGRIRRGVTHFFGNLGDPWTAVNQLLQGKPRLFVNDISRFAINTTLGAGGLLDVASRMGLDRHNEDFGQTLGVWGFGPGPYIVVPFWGPSTIRDGVGDLADVQGFLPFHLENRTARDASTALWTIKTRADYLGAEQFIQGDRYLFIRDAFLQNRRYEITDGLVEDSFFPGSAFELEDPPLTGTLETTQSELRRPASQD
jgi:phospholipid-binding lipoprotein MlaA